MSELPVFGYLNYRGNVGDQSGEVMGPNRMGEYFVVVEQSYDPNENMSRLGLAILTERN